eukprot:Tamp_26073.p1 GENE.Tamp_26073~~Tamp_26073.p1  ORF type:complete len:210 (-),score=25.82 Tamp_26073:283-864(-)
MRPAPLGLRGGCADAAALQTYTGGCHCRRVRFRVEAAHHLVCIDCSCSICRLKRNVHFVVPDKHFHVTHGIDEMTTYTFNTHTAKHLFCTTCGICCFYRPRSNPDGVAVTIYCLDPPGKPRCKAAAAATSSSSTGAVAAAAAAPKPEPSPRDGDDGEEGLQPAYTFEVMEFDGQNWEANLEASGIAQMSKSKP